MAHVLLFEFIVATNEVSLRIIDHAREVQTGVFDLADNGCLSFDLFKVVFITQACSPQAYNLSDGELFLPTNLKMSAESLKHAELVDFKVFAFEESVYGGDSVGFIQSDQE